ncbi:hypothetical protein C0J52_15003 [Blattella germanica]|nr:hypothetical protein C0J52_15003 [Blattella germanica]
MPSGSHRASICKRKFFTETRIYDHRRTWKTSLDECTAECQDLFRENTLTETACTLTLLLKHGEYGKVLQLIGMQSEQPPTPLAMVSGQEICYEPVTVWFSLTTCVLFVLFVNFLNINKIMADILQQDPDIFMEQQISGCILNISETYFNPDHPIAVQTPAMWYAIHDWDYTWYVPSGEKAEPWRSLFKAFTLKMWILVIITSVFGNLFLWFLQKTRFILNIAIPKSTKDFLYIAIIGIDLNNTNQGPGYACFLVLWLFYSLLINAAYQSTLFELMVDPGEYPPIETFDELKESGLSRKSGIFVIGKEDEYNICGDTCFADLARNRNFSVFYSIFSGTLEMDLYRDRRRAIDPDSISLFLTVQLLTLSLKFTNHSCFKSESSNDDSADSLPSEEEITCERFFKKSQLKVAQLTNFRGTYLPKLKDHEVI